MYLTSEICSIMNGPEECNNLKNFVSNIDHVSLWCITKKCALLLTFWRLFQSPSSRENWASVLSWLIDLYSLDVWFESCPQDWISWLRFLWFSSVPGKSDIMPQIRLWLYLHAFQGTHHVSSYYMILVFWATSSIVKWSINKYK